MAVYTVHEPRRRDGNGGTDPDRFVFVRDGFYVWAFLLGPVWMVWRRLWLVLLLYVVAMTGLEVTLWVLGVTVPVQFSVGFLVSILVGVEASTLQRWTFGRRRWNELGVVVAPDRESAERQFFASWSGHSVTPASASPAPTSSPWPVQSPPSPPAVVGLFPEPEPRR